MIIDTQTHYIPTSAVTLLEDPRWCGAKPTGLPNNLNAKHLMLGLHERLSEMDRLGVDVSVLSFAPVGPSPDASLDRDLARAANDGLIEACLRHPDRFVALARLPLPDVTAATEEANRVGAERCVRGFVLLPEAVNYRPDEAGVEPLLARAAECRWAVVLHPPTRGADLSEAFTAFGLTSALHAMVGSTLVLARAIFSGVLDRLPQLDVIATHLGGVAPFLAERLDMRGKGAARPFSAYLRERVYFDNCGFPDGPALRTAIEVCGANRIMLGSDWPSRPIEESLAPLAALNEGDRTAILGRTASRWFAP